MARTLPASSTCCAPLRRRGRDYDEITKTCYFVFDVGDMGENAAQVVD
jgi:hypothetical protein